MTVPDATRAVRADGTGRQQCLDGGERFRSQGSWANGAAVAIPPARVSARCDMQERPWPRAGRQGGDAAGPGPPRRHATREAYRRDIKNIRNLQGGQPLPGEKIFHGRKGQIYKRHHKGREDQFGALGLVLNCLVLWNTLCRLG